MSSRPPLSWPAMIALYGTLLASALASTLASTDAAAEPLGRLFMTPEQRAALERQRQTNIPDTRQVLDGATVSLDGVVIRSSGRSTVWVNQHPQHEGMTGTGVATRVSSRDPGRAILTPGEEAPASLKVGEAIHRAKRDKTDGLEGGRISVSR